MSVFEAPQSVSFAIAALSDQGTTETLRWEECDRHFWKHHSGDTFWAESPLRPCYFNSADTSMWQVFSWEATRQETAASSPAPESHFLVGPREPRYTLDPGGSFPSCSRTSSPSQHWTKVWNAHYPAEGGQPEVHVSFSHYESKGKTQTEKTNSMISHHGLLSKEDDFFVLFCFFIWRDQGVPCPTSFLQALQFQGEQFPVAVLVRKVWQTRRAGLEGTGILLWWPPP